MVDYEHFLNQLRQKEASPLMNHFRGFLARFNSERRPIMQQRKLVASFLHFIYGESLQNELFAEAAEDAELENIREGWEKLVMMNIYDQVFGAPGTDDVKMGLHLQRKIETFQWLQEHHLDLPFSFHHNLEVAQAELLRLNGFRAPRDKLVILHNTTQIVADLIRKASDENAGNDHLLPTLILTIVRANPPNLIGNIKYIMRFRNQTELEKGPNQFCLTNMMSAVSFIYNMSPKSLTLSDEEKVKYGVAKDLPPRPGEGSSMQRSDSTPQVSQLASKVYTSTSGWFNTLIREAKIFGEQAAGKVDGFVNQVMADSDEEENDGQTGKNRPPLPPRQQSGQNVNSYPGNIKTTGPQTANEQWMMEASPTVSPLSPVPGLGEEPRATPSPPTRPTGELSRQQEAEMEDFELQLAMALSLSSMEEERKRREEVPAGGTGDLMDAGQEDASTTKESLSPKPTSDGSNSGTIPYSIPGTAGEAVSPPTTEVANTAVSDGSSEVDVPLSKSDTAKATDPTPAQQEKESLI
ncbi:uncharacterized protein SPPG_02656 [Spizellomyces punctatus DAOM BR117]|uniref:VPS9 domain-containing protein n=1 Tax=Spizellomyces punctatus (strain DAOM BR117) TaxID=645134 RepID=A0A0L0HMY2_SPIPD|nr:uncharacterized protein SPPG_02656 [Spizellomyces punctatus DAOM BR117]KND02164.1 hypothetical protein SPPG_02656 [Spizellomyces punctatus DAOM BR117]|eukprot:XP_016610203.1 hypothetical protein SPPG_02656 [Spizellomyces punctatus DAOM BR117]